MLLSTWEGVEDPGCLEAFRNLHEGASARRDPPTSLQGWGSVCQTAQV